MVLSWLGETQGGHPLVEHQEPLPTPAPTTGTPQISTRRPRDDDEDTVGMSTTRNPYEMASTMASPIMMEQTAWSSR